MSSHAAVGCFIKFFTLSGPWLYPARAILSKSSFLSVYAMNVSSIFLKYFVPHSIFFFGFIKSSARKREHSLEAVLGMSCISPKAPFGLIASGFQLLSFCIIDFISDFTSSLLNFTVAVLYVISQSAAAPSIMLSYSSGGFWHSFPWMALSLYFSTNLTSRL